MRDEIRVHVRAPRDRGFWMLQWRDPITGKTKSRSSGVARVGQRKDRADAERVAAKVQAELESGLLPNAGKMPWEAFRERYEDEHVPSLTPESAAKIQVVFGIVGRILNPTKLRDIDERRLSHLAAELRKEGKADSTIHGYLATLKAILNWAKGQRMVNGCPVFPKIQRRKKAGGYSLMKGRPITAEEFDRMIAAVPHVVGPAAAPKWTRYLRGLWLSGLRLRESLEFWWDREDRMHPVFPRHGRPMLRVIAEYEKSNTDRLLPITPDFAEFLYSTPEEERQGPVFRLPGMRKGSLEIRSEWVGKIITKIGRKALVRVHVDPTNPDKVKYASAHDLRRAFGTRWAELVPSHMLQQLMRHKSLETTLRFYVGQDAQRTAEACWDAWATPRPERQVDFSETGGRRR
jgi:integrase